MVFVSLIRVDTTGWASVVVVSLVPGSVMVVSVLVVAVAVVVGGQSSWS